MRPAVLAFLTVCAAAPAAAGPLADVRAGATDDRVRIDIVCVEACEGRVAGKSVRITGLELARPMRAASGPAPFSLSPIDGGALLIIDDVDGLQVATEQGEGRTTVRVVATRIAAPEPKAATPPPKKNPPGETTIAAAPPPSAKPRAAPPEPSSSEQPADPVRQANARLVSPTRVSAPTLLTPEAPPAYDASVIDSALRDAPEVGPDGPGARFRAVAAAHPAPDLSPNACAAARRRLAADGWAIDALAQSAFCDAAGGEVESALSSFERILQYDPQNIVALYGRAAVAAARGDREAAMRWYDGARAAERLREAG